MNSGEESSGRALLAREFGGIESLAGLFHPHAIEVQDFGFYSLILDLRSGSEFADDHIPGAVNLDAQLIRAAPGSPPAELHPALARLVAGITGERHALVYCGRGGVDSLPVARALRPHCGQVDLLGGGWINYRRWVQAGMELLPRLILFRVISASLGHETRRILRAMATAGHQVLDIEDLAGWRRGTLGPQVGPQPSQAWFESQLVDAMRGFDARMPVWIPDTERRLGALVLTGSLGDAMDEAPLAVFEAPLAERLRRWQEDEVLWQGSPIEALEAASASTPAATASALDRWRRLARSGDAELMSAMLQEHFDSSWRAGVEDRVSRPNAMPPLKTESLDPSDLSAAVCAWMPVSYTIVG